MSVSPTFSTWLGVIITVAMAIGGGTVALTGVIPADYIPTVKNWCILFGTVGSALLTGLHAVSSTAGGPLSGAGK